MKVVVVLLLATFAVVASKDWWETALIYQIYPRSFMDSNNDGIGDLNGITSKLQYLKDTGIDAIWLSPIFLSPMADFGYDISDYREIAEEYGTMSDFDNLLAKAKELGLRLLLDFVPNHTSDESGWFINSTRRVPGYEDYYVWADAAPSTTNSSEPEPPNNWLSVFRKSAWEWSSVREQFYLHQFAIGQPDLNYRSEKVRQEMTDVIRFWLDKGVSGFRVDAINFMYEVDPADYNNTYPDEPLSNDPNYGPDDYEYLLHPYTKDLNITFDVVYNWRDVLNEYISKEQGEYKLMVTEAYTDLSSMMRYYGNGTNNGSIPFNFVFMGDVKNTSTANDIKAAIDEWMTNMPAGMTPNWVNGNHDSMRLASRVGTDRLDAMNMLALLLPGIAVTYQGEEIGMTDGYISWEDTRDPQACNTDDPVNYWKKSRDPERTPYHWDSSENAGFSKANQTWLPMASNYKEVNLAAQINATNSHYAFYKDLAEIRRSDAVQLGDLETRVLSEYVLAVIRKASSDVVVGIVNLSGANQTIDLSSIQNLPSSFKVMASGVASPLEKGTLMSANQVQITAHAAVVLTSSSSIVIPSSYLLLFFYFIRFAFH